MSRPFDLSRLRLFVTPEQRCGYLPERRARNLVADPELSGQGLYDRLIGLGFRRSGDHLYRPYCAGCAACLSLRVAAARFRPNRSQRRCRQKNADLRALWRPVRFDPEHYALYARYVAGRHPDGGMDDPDPDGYRDFLLSRWCAGLLCELRDAAGRLYAVAVVDALADGLSAVYTFFDTAADCRARGLGTLAILLLIDETARRGLPWAYLGYQIADCRKMAYKAAFRPHQVFDGGRWRWVE